MNSRNLIPHHRYSGPSIRCLNQRHGSDRLMGAACVSHEVPSWPGLLQAETMSSCGPSPLMARSCHLGTTSWNPRHLPSPSPPPATFCWKFRPASSPRTTPLSRASTSPAATTAPSVKLRYNRPHVLACSPAQIVMIEPPSYSARRGDSCRGSHAILAGIALAIGGSRRTVIPSQTNALCDNISGLCCGQSWSCRRH